MESTNQVQQIHVRCPSCLKLFIVEDREITESRPQFACNKCQTQFWLPYPEALGQPEILGFPIVDVPPVPTPEAAATMKKLEFHCPRCEAMYNGGDKECPKCGVIFAKLDLLQDGKTVTGSANLKKLWYEVIDNYGSSEAHQRFLAASQKENNLAYAAHQYQKVLSSHSGDEMALQMRKQIVALTQTQLSPATSETAVKVIRHKGYMPKITTMIIVLGGIFIGVGALMPMARNLIGFGVAIVFFTLAVEWLFSPSR